MLGTSAETLVAEPGPRPGLRGPSDDVATTLLRLAETLRKGGVSAGMLVASKEVSGFRVITNPDLATFPQLRQELATLRSRLEDALVAGHVAPSSTIEESRRSLAKAALELARPDDETGPILLRLSWAADHLLKAGKQARTDDDLTPTLARLAVSAATLWRIAARMLAPEA